MGKRYQWLRGKTSACIVIGLLITLLVTLLAGCAQPAPTPTPTQAPKPTAAKESTPAAKESKPAAKEATPVKAAKTDEKPVKVKAAYSARAGSQAAIWITKEKGLFEKNGLDLELVYIANSPAVTAAMVSGEIQFAVMGAGSAIDARIAGSDMVLLGATANVLAYSLFTKSEIQRMEDLKGKTVAITSAGSNIDTAARLALQKFNLQPDKDVALVAAGGTPETMAVMKTGAVDGVVTGPPNSVALRKDGFRELLNLADENIEFAQTGIVTKQSYLASNEATVKKFVTALVEGIAVAKKDKAFAKEVIGKYNNITDAEVLEETWDYYVNKVLRQVPYATAEGVQAYLNEAAARNAKAKEAKADTFIDMRILKGLDDSGFIKKLY